jgi:hypothetical protein
MRGRVPTHPYRTAPQPRSSKGAGYPAKVTAKEKTGPAAGPETAPRSRRLTAAAALAALEGVALAAGGLYLLGLSLFGKAAGTSQGAMAGLTVLALAALPLAAAYGLLKARRWSRGPVLIIQFIALPVAWDMAGHGGVLLAAAVALGVVAVAELVLLVSPAATDALGIGRTAAER